jgi:hypothetical protein
VLHPAAHLSNLVSYEAVNRNTYISNIVQHTSKKKRQKTLKDGKKDLHCLQLVIDWQAKRLETTHTI